MGLIHKGIPEKIARRLRDRYGLQNFVETGTHIGRTAHWAAHEFNQVISLEISPEYAQTARLNCKGLENVQIMRVDSREGLRYALALVTTPALIWLDAHWGPDLSYPRPEAGECPVLDELTQIAEDGRAHVVLVDDAHLFFEAPPAPHVSTQWPSFAALEGGSLHPSHNLTVEEGVLIFTPKNG